MGFEEFHHAESESFIPLMRRNKKWALSIVGSLFVLVLLISSARHNTDNTREYVSAWVGKHDYSPYYNVDALAHFTQSPTCHASSLDLYRPTKQVCQSRQDLLDAMSDGGRIGFDAPYQTRDCDMRWYSTSELCTILSRFDAIHMIGDSMTRHVSNAMMTLLREDLINGARTTWKTGHSPNKTCDCHDMYEGLTCWRDGYAVTGTDAVWENDPDSMKCPRSSIANIDFQWSAKDPAPEPELEFFKKSVRGEREAFVFGHGNWEDYAVDPTKRWIREFEAAFAEVIPGIDQVEPVAKPEDTTTIKPKDHIVRPIDPDTLALAPRMEDQKGEGDLDPRAQTSREIPPRLFLTPNAQGLLKNDKHISSQNNIWLMRFEREMRSWLSDREWDTVGTFNLTVQSVSWDGTHATMENNLVKAMMVSRRSTDVHEYELTASRCLTGWTG